MRRWLDYFPYLTDTAQLRRLLIGHAVIFLGSVLLFYPYYLSTLHGLIDRDNNPFGRDFISYWTAITLVREGRFHDICTLTDAINNFARSIDPNIRLFWGYPPFTLFLLWPFTLFGYAGAYAAWTAFNAAAFALAVFWRTKLTGAWRWIAFSAPALLLDLFIGQNGLLSAALILGGFRLLSGAPVLSGILFGLLAYKPQLGLVIPIALLALRQWRCLFAATATVAVLVAASAVTLGLESWTCFLTNLWSSQSALLELAAVKMISVYAATQVLHLPSDIATLIQAVVTLTTLFLLYTALRRMRQSHWTEWLLLITPALYLVTPYAYVYDLCALHAAWLLWLVYRPQPQTLSPLATGVWLALWYVPLFNQQLNEHYAPLLPLLLIAAFALSLRSLRKG